MSFWATILLGVGGLGGCADGEAASGVVEGVGAVAAAAKLANRIAKVVVRSIFGSGGGEPRVP